MNHDQHADWRTSVDAEAYEAGLRAGYAHGYDIGLAHGRAEHDIEHADVPGPRLAGPDRAELLERGYIPRDTTRPPALPVRMWTGEDWAKADLHDLPITDTGRAAWRDALDAGRVPARLAEAFTAAEAAARDSGADPDSAADRDAAGVLAHLQGRGRSHPDRPATGLHDMPQERWSAAIEVLRGRGHRIDTVLVTGGDRARNETGYLLQEPAPAARETSIDALRAAVEDTGRRIAELRAGLAEAELGVTHRRTTERDQQRVADVTRWFAPHNGDQAELKPDDGFDRAGGR